MDGSDLLTQLQESLRHYNSSAAHMLADVLRDTPSHIRPDALAALATKGNLAITEGTVISGASYSTPSTDDTLIDAPVSPLEADVASQRMSHATIGGGLRSEPLKAQEKDLGEILTLANGCQLRFNPAGDIVDIIQAQAKLHYDPNGKTLGFLEYADGRIVEVDRRGVAADGINAPVVAFHLKNPKVPNPAGLFLVTPAMADDARAGHAARRAETMTFDDYQAWTREYAVYPLIGGSPVFPALELAEEAGEVAGKIKKLWRDNNLALDDGIRADIAKEIGDVFWAAAQLACELDLSLQGIAQLNLAKIQDRAARGVVAGSGDNR